MAIPAIKLGARRVLEGDHDEATQRGQALEILRWGDGKFTLGYNGNMPYGGNRNLIYSPCLSFPEALYLLSHARFNGILTLPPSEQLLCYVESLASSARPPSKPFSARTSTKPDATSAKPRSTSKPGKAVKSSTGRG